MNPTHTNSAWHPGSAAAPKAVRGSSRPMCFRFALRTAWHRQAGLVLAPSEISDAIANRLNISKVQLIKIDVEGMELDVLLVSTVCPMLMRSKTKLPLNLSPIAIANPSGSIAACDSA
jgi:hypothetical protein